MGGEGFPANRPFRSEGEIGEEVKFLPGKRHGYADAANYFFWVRADYFCRHLIGDMSERIDMVELNREREQIGDKGQRRGPGDPTRWRDGGGPGPCRVRATGVRRIRRSAASSPNALRTVTRATPNSRINAISPGTPALKRPSCNCSRSTR